LAGSFLKKTTGHGWRYIGLILLLVGMVLLQVSNTAISATLQAVGQMSDKRFGLIVTGSPSPTALNANLALLGNQRSWYSYDHTIALAQDNRQRVHLVKTGTQYSSNMAALKSYVQTMPTGSYWMIGNEPNVDGQDDATPAQYATQYETIKTAIRATEPTAKMVGPSILNWDQSCENCSGFPLGKDWIPQMLTAYQSQTGHAIDFDVWGIHTYGITWNHLPMTLITCLSLLQSVLTRQTWPNICKNMGIRSRL
jgi:hypothetical protein